jgi:DNA-binding NarL/FixJ family response regulator
MKILLIDDNATHRLIYRVWLEKTEDYTVIEASDTKAGTEAVIRERPDCVILDFMMNGENGFQMLHQIKKDIPDCPPIIFVTCAFTESMKRNVMALGAYACFEKSKLDQAELCKVVNASINVGQGK